MDKLAVVVPSRGLMFSQTLEELLRELAGYKYEIFWAHGLSLPDCFNEPTERALADPDVFAVLYVEDDMILPEGIVELMFAQNWPAMAADYPFRSNGDATILHDPDGNCIWTGTGLLLVAKAILENMPKPIWRVDTTWDMMVKQTTLYLWPRKLKKVAYGLHDMYFGILLYSQKLPIHDVGINAGQRKLVKLGTAHSNNGQHKIKELRVVGRDLVNQASDMGKIDLYRNALKRTKTVEILGEIPDWIEYKDGLAHYVGGDEAVEYV